MVGVVENAVPGATPPTASETTNRLPRDAASKYLPWAAWVTSPPDLSSRTNALLPSPTTEGPTFPMTLSSELLTGILLGHPARCIPTDPPPRHLTAGESDRPLALPQAVLPRLSSPVWPRVVGS